MSLLRMPRYWLSEKKHRFTGFKPGDLVWSIRRERHKLVVKRYKVTRIDDFYDSCGGRKTPHPRKQYNLAIDTEPYPTPKYYNPWPLNSKAIQSYNKKLSIAGYIGHSVESTELFHTKGEALFSLMMD